MSIRFFVPGEEHRADLERLLSQLSERPVRAIIRTEAPNTHVVGVFEGEQLVGVGVLIMLPKLASTAGTIEEIVVDKVCRGQGFGKAIMDELITRARELGVTSLGLTSRPSRVTAHKLYLDCGFKQRETDVFELKL